MSTGRTAPDRATETATARDVNADPNLLNDLARIADHTHLLLIRNPATSMETLKHIANNAAPDVALAARLRIQRDLAPPPLEATAPSGLSAATISHDIRVARDPGTDRDRLLELEKSARHTHHALAQNESAWPELLHRLLEYGDITTKLRVVRRPDNALGTALREVTQELFGSLAPVTAHDAESRGREQQFNAAHGIQGGSSNSGAGFGVNTEDYRSLVRSNSAVGFGASSGAQPQTVYVHNTDTGTNGFAVASLVCSLLGFSLFGIIFGHVAMRQINRDGGYGWGMALAGTIVGYVIFAISVILALRQLG